MLLAADNLSKTLGMRLLFSGVRLSIDHGERVGLIGPNGAGKSTLLRLLSSTLMAKPAPEWVPDTGSIVVARGARCVYVPQVDWFGAPGAAEEGEITARQVVIDSAIRARASADVHDEHEAEVLADMLLSQLGFDEGRGPTSLTRASRLSGGWRKRLSIARGLAACGGAPDLLMLDEPTNHLDVDGIRWLESLLTGRVTIGTKRRGFAAVFVTHDRTFLENIATRVVELSSAYPEGTLSAEGNYTEFLRRKGEFLSGQAQAQQALANQVRRDLAWLARGPEARRTKAKSRIESSHERIDELAVLESRNAAAATTAAGVDFVGTGRKTRKFIQAIGITQTTAGLSRGGATRDMGDESSVSRTLFAEVNVALGAGDCLGLLGPNGSGKTTLIRVLTGEVKPEVGEVKVCEPRPRVVVFSQHRREFEPGTLLKDALCPVSDVVRFRGGQMHITSWSRRFLFRDEQLLQPVGALSGGELARVHIARVMLEPADVLVLDEPTNDLDIPTLEVLEEALEEFEGALILVTHDRAMLGRLSTHVMGLDGLGTGGAKVYADLDQAINGIQEAQQRLTREESQRKQAEQKRHAASASSAGVAIDTTSATALTATSEQAVSAAPRKKLSYQLQREFDGMEQQIMKAEAAASSADEAMNSAMAGSDHAKITRMCEAAASAHGLVQRLYARWEELEGMQRGS